MSDPSQPTHDLPREQIHWACCGCGREANWSGGRSFCGACGSREREAWLFAPIRSDAAGRQRQERSMTTPTSRSGSLEPSLPPREFRRQAPGVFAFRHAGDVSDDDPIVYSAQWKAERDLYRAALERIAAIRMPYKAAANLSRTIASEALQGRRI